MAGSSVKIVFILSCLSTLTVECSGGNILLVSANSVSSPSHYMALSTLTGALVSNGHNVTLVTNDVIGTKGFANGTFSKLVTFKASYQEKDVEKVKRIVFHEAASGSLGFTETLKVTSDVFTLQYNSCLDLWRDRQVVNALNNSHFDFALVYPFSSCDILVAHYFNIPFAVFFSTIRFLTFHEGYIGMPLPASYVPFDIQGTLTDEMTFAQKIQNLMASLIYHVVQYICNLPFHSIQVEFGISPDKSIRELYSKASLYLAHVSLGSDFPRPFTPNFIPVGGLVAKPIKPLQRELAEFVEGSGDHGVIIFSLGSHIPGFSDQDTTEVFARVFKRLPQRVLWKHNEEPPADIGNNTRLLKWLPQNDLLGHPKTRLLIYHGGSNGVLEAISHGVPMVNIPVFADQFSHAARIQKKGMGLMLDKSNITEGSLMAVITEVLQNPSYKIRAKLYSDIDHDLPMTPVERAVYWIEHVMKFGDAHLRPRSADMNFVELYMIDVTVFIFFVSVLSLYVEYVLLKKCYRICCHRVSEKLKSE